MENCPGHLETLGTPSMAPRTPWGHLKDNLDTMDTPASPLGTMDPLRTPPAAGHAGSCRRPVRGGHVSRGARRELPAPGTGRSREPRGTPGAAGARYGAPGRSRGPRRCWGRTRFAPRRPRRRGVPGALPGAAAAGERGVPALPLPSAGSGRARPSLLSRGSSLRSSESASGWRTVKQLELQEREGEREKEMEKEASGPCSSVGSANIGSHSAACSPGGPKPRAGERSRKEGAGSEFRSRESRGSSIKRFPWLCRCHAGSLWNRMSI
ncbi:uncharacterized protein LOC141972095 [Athene noctua]|uniref:uncharacterized protein LOC141972095 n=1 Tax=Athene noctua TaxID=126797 RepID=UPI003EB72A1D